MSISARTFRKAFTESLAGVKRYKDTHQRRKIRPGSSTAPVRPACVSELSALLILLPEHGGKISTDTVFGTHLGGYFWGLPRSGVFRGPPWRAVGGGHLESLPTLINDREVLRQLLSCSPPGYKKFGKFPQYYLHHFHGDSSKCCLCCAATATSFIDSNRWQIRFFKWHR